MSTPASIARHPIHPMLVVFPIGLFVAAFVFDVLAAATGNGVWRTVAFYDIAAGIVGGLLAAVPGFVDYFSLGGSARRTATWHMVLNLGLVGLFAVNWLLRTSTGARWIPPGSNIPLILTACGVVILGVSGWLGGHLVYVQGVGVERPPRDESLPRRRVA
jgi:uncharacterized membrane protein